MIVRVAVGLLLAGVLGAPHVRHLVTRAVAMGVVVPLLLGELLDRDAAEVDRRAVGELQAEVDLVTDGELVGEVHQHDVVAAGHQHLLLAGSHCHAVRGLLHHHGAVTHDHLVDLHHLGDRRAGRLQDDVLAGAVADHHERGRHRRVVGAGRGPDPGVGDGDLAAVGGAVGRDALLLPAAGGAERQGGAQHGRQDRLLPDCSLHR